MRAYARHRWRWGEPLHGFPVDGATGDELQRGILKRSHGNGPLSTSRTVGIVRPSIPLQSNAHGLPGLHLDKQLIAGARVRRVRDASHGRRARTDEARLRPSAPGESAVRQMQTHARFAGRRARASTLCGLGISLIECAPNGVNHVQVREGPPASVKLTPYKPKIPGKGLGKLMVVTLGRRDGLTSLPFGQFRAPFMARNMKSENMFVAKYRKAVGLSCAAPQPRASREHLRTARRQLQDAGLLVIACWPPQTRGRAGEKPGSHRWPAAGNGRQREFGGRLRTTGTAALPPPQHKAHRLLTGRELTLTITGSSPYR